MSEPEAGAVGREVWETVYDKTSGAAGAASEEVVCALGRMAYVVHVAKNHKDNVKDEFAGPGEFLSQEAQAAMRDLESALDRLGRLQGLGDTDSVY